MPLKLASWMGILLSLGSLPVLAYAVYRWQQGQVVPGWTSLMVLLLVGGGQMLVLGVMGKYLGRLYMEAKRRPMFVVRRIATSQPSSAPGPAATAAPVAEPELVVVGPSALGGKRCHS